MATTAINLLAR
jgi:hypothetical protein